MGTNLHEMALFLVRLYGRLKEVRKLFEAYFIV